MFLEWLPWRFVVRHVARAQGFLDPIQLLSRLHRFAQPASVIAPTELLRSGAVLHARGLINSQAIQHNLDWVWPFWVVRQFDPLDEAFVPRAFSLTHINLTHRNWTAVGLPDAGAFPLVDPRGLVTPLFDGWSLDAWIIGEDRTALIPSRAPSADQRCLFEDGLAVTTATRAGGLALESRVEMVDDGDGTVACRMRVTGRAQGPAWLVVSLRPYNPEGVSFVHHIATQDGGWKVNGRDTVRFSQPPDRSAFSQYRDGDVFRRLPDVLQAQGGIECPVGMATAAALFDVGPEGVREVDVRVPVHLHEPSNGRAAPRRGGGSWLDSLQGHCQLHLPHARVAFLYEAALRALILHSPGDIYPGPYTYRRFWFRDAAFIAHAMLCAGLVARTERCLDRFPSRQNAAGYFLSQDGEWDSNGEALWIFHRFCQLTGRPAKAQWREPIRRAVRWIQRKRLPQDRPEPHAGLLPSGFSAEHFGPNDYYYWDDFWAVAGLRSAGAMMAGWGEPEPGRRATAEADDLDQCVQRSLDTVASRLGTRAMPASPYRRLDAAAIGSLAASYPLQLFEPRDARALQTADYLLGHSFLDGAFFQAISHSGMNPYLTLHVAQVLLRAGDPRFHALIDGVAALASPTGQWPEAVHPRTKGGCMGDGQHIWASAEWVLMIRNCFVREEPGRLILGSGVPDAWLKGGEEVSFGPTPTAFGEVTVSFQPGSHGVTVQWHGLWHGEEPAIEIHAPGCAPLTAGPGQQRAVLTPGTRA